MRLQGVAVPAEELSARAGEGSVEDGLFTKEFEHSADHVTDHWLCGSSIASTPYLSQGNGGMRPTFRSSSLQPVPDLAQMFA